jgi:DNA-directed RNA polymerase sigma subunit (sigma70/sigma32)
VIGQELGLSRQRIGQIEAAAAAELAAILAPDSLGNEKACA